MLLSDGEDYNYLDSEPWEYCPWKVSLITSSTGRMITEKLVCDEFRRQGEYVRVLVNDAVHALGHAGEDGHTPGRMFSGYLGSMRDVVSLQLLLVYLGGGLGSKLE
ncbi:hypothetical protein JVU11DRAFT_2157 [Chiua virens]|nr:hypothetical protein JVU11DRAFT_2157 [Chiua virens]